MAQNRRAIICIRLQHIHYGINGIVRFKNDSCVKEYVFSYIFYYPSCTVHTFRTIYYTSISHKYLILKRQKFCHAWIFYLIWWWLDSANWLSFPINLFNVIIFNGIWRRTFPLINHGQMHGTSNNVSRWRAVYFLDIKDIITAFLLPT